MNTRIFTLIMENLNESFKLAKYDHVKKSLDKDTRIDFLPWTPARQKKFEAILKKELDFKDIDLQGTVKDVVANLDRKYMERFFGQIWKPKTDKYEFSGWALVDRINNTNPKKVLDFGCGYNIFKDKINNIIGIDPYNKHADYMVDILEFAVEPKSFDHIIVFGSLNFGDKSDIEMRFSKLNEILMPGGRMYFRANPGHLWPTGPYVDIFPWSFKVAYELCQKHNLTLEAFKKDNGDRLYFEVVKNG